MQSFFRVALFFITLYPFHLSSQIAKSFASDYNEKLENLYQSSINLLDTDPLKAQEFALKLIDSSSKSQYKYLGLGYYCLGESYYYQNHYDEALQYYMKANPYFYLIKDSIHISSTLRNLGLIHLYKSDYNKSLTLYEQSLNISEAINDTEKIAICYQNMGIVLGALKKFDIQQTYYNKALVLYKVLKDEKSMADINLNLGYSYINTGQFSKGADHYNEALSVYKKDRDSSRIASVYNNLGCLYMRKNDPKKAEDYYNTSEEIFKKLNDKQHLIHTYMGLGDVCNSKNDKTGAIEYYKKSEELNEELGYVDIKMENLQNLSNAYKAIGEYSTAINLLEEYYALKDSLFYTNQNDKVLEIENKYKFQMNKNKLAEVSAKNRLYLIIIIISLSILIIAITLGWFYLRTKRLENKQRLLSLEQKVLRTQMNPHFIFNSLSAIQCYILENKSIDAVEFLAEFAGLMRMVLQFSQEEFITLEQEREILDYYIKLQNRRFGDKITYDITLDHDLDAGRVLVPPMLGQPFIENSFEHGDLINKSDGNITVSFKRKDKKLLYIIEDNGIGINSVANENANTKKHKSLAMKITKERLNLMNNKYFQNKVSLTVEDRIIYQKEGTKVEFTLPFVEMS